MIGYEVSTLLLWVDAILRERKTEKVGYTDNGVEAAVRIFESVMADGLDDLCSREEMTDKVKSEMAEHMRVDIRRLMKTYCDIGIDENLRVFKQC